MTPRKNARTATKKATTPPIDSFLPLTEAGFELLLSLADGPRHGYAILRDIEERTDGAVTLHAGTLYRAIFRMVDQGLIEERDERPDEADDARRRYYALTPLGRTVAEAEASRLAARVATARSRKLLAGRARAV